MDIAEFFKRRKIEKDNKSKDIIDDEIRCPVCQEDLTDQYFNKRNEHVESCLMKCEGEEETGILEIKIHENNDSFKETISLKRRTKNSVQSTVTEINSVTNPIVLSDDEINENGIIEVNNCSRFSKDVSTNLNEVDSLVVNGKPVKYKDENLSQYHEEWENIQVIESSKDEEDLKPLKAKRKKRVCKPKPLPPSFKTISFPGLNELIMVDGFQFEHPDVSKYFLTHFHSDHYIGLNKSFSNKIYCSKITAKLLQINMNFEEEFIFPMNLNERYEILAGLYVSLIDANHCPGAVLFMFEYFQKDKFKRVLHTGDFRFCYQHYQLFKDLYFHELYLDTTYFIINSNSYYVHPIQKNIIKQTSEDIVSFLNSMNKNSILKFFKEKKDDKFVIALGIYSIGKENLFLNLANHLKIKIYTSKRHYKTLSQYLRSLENIIPFSNINEIIDTKYILLVPLRYLKSLKLNNLNYKLIKIQPTGWAGRLFHSKNLKDPIQKLSNIFQKDNKKAFIDWEAKVVRLPYSEHSNMKELIILLNKLNYGKIIPTVNVKNHLDYSLLNEITKLKISNEDVEKYFEINQPELNDFYI